MASPKQLIEGLKALGVLLERAGKGAKTTVKRDPRSIEKEGKLIPTGPTKVSIDPDRFMDDPEGVTAALDALERQINRFDTTTKGTFGPTIFHSPDPSLSNTQLLKDIGQPELPLFPREIPSRTVNPTAPPRVPGPGNFTPEPKPPPVVDRLNVLRDPDVVPRKPDPRGPGVLDPKIQSSPTKLGTRSAGIPDSPERALRKEKAGRSDTTQGSTIEESQTAFSSGTEEVSQGPTLKSKVAQSVRDFRGDRPRSPATDKFAVDQRVLLNKTGITQRLKAFKAQQFERFDPTVQRSPEAVGPEFNALNDQLQADYNAASLLAENDPRTQAAIDALDLDVNDITRNSLGVQIYNRLNPGALPANVRQDIKFFEQLRSRAQRPTQFNIETGQRRPVPEIEEQLNQFGRKDFPDEFVPDDPEDIATPSPLQLQFDEVSRRTPAAGFSRSSIEADAPQMDLPLTRVFPETPGTENILGAESVTKRMDALQEARGMRSRVRSGELTASPESKRIAQERVKLGNKRLRDTTNRVIGGELPDLAKQIQDEAFPRVQALKNRMLQTDAAEKARLLEQGTPMGPPVPEIITPPAKHTRGQGNIVEPVVDSLVGKKVSVPPTNQLPEGMDEAIENFPKKASIEDRIKELQKELNKTFPGDGAHEGLSAELDYLKEQLGK